MLRRAYREWPLFGVLLDNAAMSLAKTDRLIGARYLALGGRDDLTERVLAEYDLTRRLVLAVTGHDRLLADRHVLARAVALRDPYVDALSYLQLRALAALRGLTGDTPDDERERLERLLLLSVNGVAAGLQNTGRPVGCRHERDAVAYAPARTGRPDPARVGRPGARGRGRGDRPGPVGLLPRRRRPAARPRCAAVGRRADPDRRRAQG